jgi:hypothetical protein
LPRLLAETGFREIYLRGVRLPGTRASVALSKLNAEWSFLTHLRDLGRAAAGSWLERSFERIGGGSTMDLSPFRNEPAGIEPAARVAAPVPDGM